MRKLQTGDLRRAKKLNTSSGAGGDEVNQPSRQVTVQGDNVKSGVAPGRPRYSSW
jgi:hypothetical protein